MMLWQHIVLRHICLDFFVFKQKTAYEMRISDWSSDVCSSDLLDEVEVVQQADPHDGAENMQPAEEEGAESVAVVALRSDVKQQQNYRQNEAGDYCVSQRIKDPSHFHSHKQRYSPCFDASREALVVTLRCLNESRPA